MCSPQLYPIVKVETYHGRPFHRTPIKELRNRMHWLANKTNRKHFYTPAHAFFSQTATPPHHLHGKDLKLMKPNYKMAVLACVCVWWRDGIKLTSL